LVESPLGIDIRRAIMKKQTDRITQRWNTTPRSAARFTATVGTFWEWKRVLILRVQAGEGGARGEIYFGAAPQRLSVWSAARVQPGDEGKQSAGGNILVLSCSRVHACLAGFVLLKNQQKGSNGHGTTERLRCVGANQSVHAIVNWRGDAPIANA